jgi:hypothetical protein
MGHPQIVRRGIRVEDMHYGDVGPNCLLDRIMNCSHSWCPPGSCVSYCQVYTLARLTIDTNLRDILKNG